MTPCSNINCVKLCIGAEKSRLYINLIYTIAVAIFVFACNQVTDDEPDNTETFEHGNVSVDGVSGGLEYQNVDLQPVIELTFNMPVSMISALAHIKMVDVNNVDVPVQLNFADEDHKVIVIPARLQQWQQYSLNISASLTARNGSALGATLSVKIATTLDQSDKFPRITDEELLTLVQRQTFKYFWDFGHPVSGMARERNTSGNTVTTGGTGFGVMAMIVAVEREFITKDAALERIQTIVSFLKNNCTRYHGAFSHWINGQTGATVPFSVRDNGADLVETSLLMQGLLTARRYFSESSPAETKLREDITELWEDIDWNWFRRDGQNMLFWHWSDNFGWEMNHPVRGWDECLITYVLAASSPTNPIPPEVYHEGWARSGGIRNGNSYYGHTLPLGFPFGGPLFFAHYSFLGINPGNLRDEYANYWEQNTQHVLINMNHCIINPNNFLGYSADCWGLTASDGNTGYSAHSPTNDRGVIAPTAALASMPYTPEESMRALHFFYYKLGDRLWKDYGFIDAFNVTAGWYANSFIAIDQGPIIVMIENYRTGLIWDIFMTCPEIQSGLTKLGFTF